MTGASERPAELGALRARAETLADLGRVQALLIWDQNTYMPARGAAARGDHLAALETIAHERLTDPELGRLLDALEPWAAGEDPDADDVRLVAVLRRDFDKAVRVPTALAAEISRASVLGHTAWQEARAVSDYGRFRDALALQLDLRQRYIACFAGHEHPYDVLLDDFEPDMTVARLRPLLGELRARLVPLVAGAARSDGVGVFGGPHAVGDQRRAMLDVLAGIGFDQESWRLDVAVHPFAQGIAHGDVRMTTRYDRDDFAGTYFSCLHEFGHALYESAIPARLARSPLGLVNSLGIHESQSRLWENVIGRSRPFCAWVLPRLAAALPGGLACADPEQLYRGVNAVAPSLIRVAADETTYNLHVCLRFELELALVEGALGVDELPDAWNEGMRRLLGVEVPDDAHGVLQDVHWSEGLFGYFPTYALGNLIAAQLWGGLRSDLPDVEALIERGELAPVRDWLRERIHVHGRKLPAHELLRRATGQELAVAPFADYLTDKLVDTGVLARSALG